MRREVKIGMFLTVASLILMIFIFIVGDLTVLFRKKGYPLYVSFDSAAGLERRAVVRMAGVKVGYVKDIRLKGSRAQVFLDIDPGVMVPHGSKATLAALGLLGEKYIEILPTEEPRFCEPGETIEGVPPVSFDQLGTLLLSIGDEVKEMGRTLREMIGGEESRADFRDTLQNLASFTADLKDFFGENKEELSQSFQRSSQAIQRLDERVDNASRSLDELIQVMREMVEENRENVKLNLESIKDLIKKTEESLRLLNESLEKVNKGEGTLGKLINQPELYHKAKGAVDGLEQVVQPLTALRLSGGLRGDYYGQSDLVKSYLSLSLQPTPKKYILAQVVHDPWLDKFTYSAQGGIRWGSLSPRAGVMESEIGAGIDYYAFDDRIRFSLEGFDFNRRPRPHLRFWTRYGAAKYINFILGIDDFSLAEEREIFFGLELNLQ